MANLKVFLGVPLPLDSFSHQESLVELERGGVFYSGKLLPEDASLEEIEFLRLHLYSLVKTFPEAVLIPVDAARV